MNRLPRKIKKQLKQKFLHRYGINWNIFKYDKNRLLIEYQWFFNNPFNWNMNKKLTKYTHNEKT